MQALSTADYRGTQTWQDIRHIEADEENYPMCVLLLVAENAPLLTGNWCSPLALKVRSRTTSGASTPARIRSSLSERDLERADDRLAKVKSDEATPTNGVH